MTDTPFRNLFRVLVAGALLLGRESAAQTTRVEGLLTNEAGLPISGATVRLTGISTIKSDASGRFRFDSVIPGRYILAVAAIGYEVTSVPLRVWRDTSLSITMARRPVPLDTMLVLPRYLRVRVRLEDSATGEKLMDAQAALYPGGRVVGGTGGVVVFDSVLPGRLVILAEALEHLPVRLELDVVRDTSLRVRLGIDSVALRMTALQVQRLAGRTRSIAMPTIALNRTAVLQERTINVGEIIDRRSYGFIDPSVCYFLDDMRVERNALEPLAPELIERIELFRRGGSETPSLRGRPKNGTARNFGALLMIRVYTRRYVATLPRRQELPKVLYVQNGTRPVCP